MKEIRENNYGHQYVEKITKSNLVGAHIIRTDIDSGIVIIFNGSKITGDKKSSPVKENAPPSLKAKGTA